ncbi:Sec-independent protein translocase protein TatB [Chloroflexi bacterium TSY]|nr:Sec-independent protein translocase protein TatB [Chloroflexi bacterium TSY]
MDSFALFGVGVPELFLIAIIALIILGPERLPQTLRQVAGFIRQLRIIANELTSQFGEELEVLDEMNPRKILEEATRPLEETSASLKEAAKPINEAKKDLSKASATLKNAGKKTGLQTTTSSQKSTKSVTEAPENGSENTDSPDTAVPEETSQESDSSTALAVNEKNVENALSESPNEQDQSFDSNRDEQDDGKTTDKTEEHQKSEEQLDLTERIKATAPQSMESLPSPASTKETTKQVEEKINGQNTVTETESFDENQIAPPEMLAAVQEEKVAEVTSAVESVAVVTNGTALKSDSEESEEEEIREKRNP